jgi:hypothetical protein
VVLVILAAYLSATRGIRSHICVLLGRLLFVYLDSNYNLFLCHIMHSGSCGKKLFKDLLQHLIAIDDALSKGHFLHAQPITIIISLKAMTVYGN